MKTAKFWKWKLLKRKWKKVKSETTLPLRPLPRMTEPRTKKADEIIIVSFRPIDLLSHPPSSAKIQATPTVTETTNSTSKVLISKSGSAFMSRIAPETTPVSFCRDNFFETTRAEHELGSRFTSNWNHASKRWSHLII